MSDRMDKYEPIKVLGEGSFGKVYLMRHVVLRSLVCIKVIKIKNIPRKERENCKMEVDLLKRLTHPNIVGYKESFMHQNRESLCIVMQYCDGGDLCAKIEAQKNKLFPEQKILHWFVQMALGLHYMHEERVLHRDLKTQNIFMLGNGRLVLGDLGISKVLDGTMDFASTCIGTPYYMSPEIFKDLPYNHKSDIWALGCVLYEMTTLKHAFNAQNYNGLVGKIIKGKYPPCDPKYSKHLRDLIAAMLSTSPAARPDLPVILSKPFIKHHIKNFFADVASRPEASMGEGTLVMHSAASNIAAQRSGMKPTHASTPEMDSLVTQLQTLKLDHLMSAVMDVSSRSDKPNSSRGGVKGMKDNRREKLKAKEQAGALRREEERRQAVAAALERLREDRVKRGTDAAAIRRKQRERDAQRAGGAGRYVPGQRGYERNRNAALPAANERGRQRPSAEPKVAVQHNKGGRNQRDRRRVADLDGWEQQHVVDSQVRDPPSRPRRDRSSSRDNRTDAVSQQDNHAHRDMLNERAVAEAAAEARQLERREREKQRERQMQLAEIEKLKEAKLELDRRDGERRARVQENIRPRNIEMKEGSPERIIVRDALPRTPIDHMHNPPSQSTIRNDQHTIRQDDTIMVSTRQQSTLLFPNNNTIEYQQTQMRDPDRYVGTMQQTLEESKSQSTNGAAAAPGSLMNARERMLARKAERADELREMRMQELRDSNVSQHAAARAQAKDHERRMYSSRLDTGHRESKDSQVAEAKSSMRGASIDLVNDPLGMNADELMAKLNEADGGGGRRFEVQQQDVAPSSRSNPLDSPSSASTTSPTQRGAAVGDDIGGNVDISSDDLLGSSDGSDFDSEDEGWARPEVREDGVDDADIDIQKHEEELEAELQQCTLRCASLRKTLVQTKSMLKLKGNSPVAASVGGPIVDGGGGGIQPDDIIADIDVEDDVEDVSEDEEDDEEEEEGKGMEEEDEDEEEEELRANSSLIREATGMGPQLTHLNIPPPKFPVTPKRKPSSGCRPSPELSDQLSPKGRLGDRVSVLRQRCVEGLGQSKFDAAHAYLKQIQDDEETGEEDDETLQQKRLTVILGHELVHYSSLIDQLIFMEDTLLD